MALFLSQVMRVETSCLEEREADPLIHEIKKFWEVESEGSKVLIENPSIDSQFESDIAFVDGKYQCKMPFKEEHPLLPDNYTVAKSRLNSLLCRLKANPKVAKEYDNVIKDQLEKGIVEKVDLNEPTEVGKVSYLPHKMVIREDKDTTKLRVVFDASAKKEGPSLNECLNAGPALLPMLVDILMRFRLNKVVLLGDIEKAFLNVSIDPSQRDYLRFLWVENIESDEPEIVVLRFTSAVFGVICSPYLSNATIRYHLELYQETDPDFVENVRNSLYCDDYVSSFENESEAFEQYEKLKQCFSDAGFNMRKWKSNSKSLIDKIEANGNENVSKENETKTEVSSKCENEADIPKPEKVLGISWNREADKLIFEFDKISENVDEENVTKRTILSTVAKFFDPLGVIAPVILPLKVLFQNVCKEKCDWDTPMNDEIKETFLKIISDLRKTGNIEFERAYLDQEISAESIESIALHGFCDASTIGYGACVLILCMESISNRFQREYLTELREHHREIKKNRGTIIGVGHVVTIYENRVPRHRWRLGRVEKLLRGKDGAVRSAVVRVTQKGQRSTTIKRQLRKLFPVELTEVDQEVRRSRRSSLLLTTRWDQFRRE